MKNLIFLSFIALFVSGCSAPYEAHCDAITNFSAGFQCRQDAKAQHEREVNQRNYSAQCTGYGFKQGTNEFANCMMQMDANKRNQDALAQQQLRQLAKDLQPQFIQPVCPSVLNARPGQYPGCN